MLLATECNMNFQSARRPLNLIDCFEICYEHTDKCERVCDADVSHGD